jgi:hypothetical protein
VYSLDFSVTEWDFTRASLGPPVLMPQILTANRLVIGEVVYWNQARGWVSRFDQAQVLANSEAEAALQGAADSVLKGEVVAPYLFDVRVKNGTAVPVKIREAIRAAGPTVRLDLGKQAH